MTRVRMGAMARAKGRVAAVTHRGRSNVWDGERQGHDEHVHEHGKYRGGFGVGERMGSHAGGRVDYDVGGHVGDRHIGGHYGNKHVGGRNRGGQSEEDDGERSYGHGYERGNELGSREERGFLLREAEGQRWREPRPVSPKLGRGIGGYPGGGSGGGGGGGGGGSGGVGVDCGVSGEEEKGEGARDERKETEREEEKQEQEDALSYSYRRRRGHLSQSTNASSKGSPALLDERGSAAAAGSGGGSRGRGRERVYSDEHKEALELASSEALRMNEIKDDLSAVLQRLRGGDALPDPSVAEAELGELEELEELGKLSPPRLRGRGRKPWSSAIAGDDNQAASSRRPAMTTPSAITSSAMTSSPSLPPPPPPADPVSVSLQVSALADLEARIASLGGLLESFSSEDESTPRNSPVDRVMSLAAPMMPSPRSVRSLSNHGVRADDGALHSDPLESMAAKVAGGVAGRGGQGGGYGGDGEWKEEAAQGGQYFDSSCSSSLAGSRLSTSANTAAPAASVSAYAHALASVDANADAIASAGAHGDDDPTGVVSTKGGTNAIANAGLGGDTSVAAIRNAGVNATAAATAAGVSVAASDLAKEVEALLRASGGSYDAPSVPAPGNRSHVDGGKDRRSGGGRVLPAGDHYADAGLIHDEDWRTGSSRITGASMAGEKKGGASGMGAGVGTGEKEGGGNGEGGGASTPAWAELEGMADRLGALAGRGVAGLGAGGGGESAGESAYSSSRGLASDVYSRSPW
eukprot:jgi/Undpi1/2181/HiC_scaffold_12.g05567.m1